MMTALRRTVACGFSLEQSLTIEQLKQMPPQQIEGRLLDVQLLFSPAIRPFALAPPRPSALQTAAPWPTAA